MDRIRVAVLLGGPSAEHEASLRGGAHVVSSLDRRRYEARPVLVTKEGRWRVAAKPWEGGRGGKDDAFDPFAPDRAWKEHAHALSALDDLRARRVDVVLPVLHGRFGEDGTVQACLAAAGLRFAGSGARACAVAADKVRTKEVLGFHRIRTAPFLVLDPADLDRGRPLAAADALDRLGSPVVVKDPLGDSPAGVRIARDARDAVLAFEALSPPAERLLVEGFVRGVEVAAAVVDDREHGRPLALPIVERPGGASARAGPRDGRDGAAARDVCPARLPTDVEAKGRALALRVHAILGLRGLSRTDAILEDDGAFTVLAVHTMPGLSPTSVVPRAAAAAGIEFGALLDRLVRTAGVG